MAFIQPFYTTITPIVMRHFFLLLFCTLFVLSASAQRRKDNRYLECGIMFGVNNYSGDVSYQRVEIEETRPGFGIYTRYRFTHNFSMRAQIYSGSISGNDIHATAQERRERSFKFGTSIFEGALLAEWTFFNGDRYSKTGIHNSGFRPYIFAGIGFAKADPKTEYYGPEDKRNLYLRTPLPEEGLAKNFILAPLGGGIYYELNEAIVFGLEGSIRPVFSDDIDGVRTNGNPKANDWYYFAGVTLSMIMGRAGGAR
jgi:Domain of unknown function (DUF6089)